MKKRNLKALSLHKKSISNLMFEVKGAKLAAHGKRTQSAIALCPGCPTIQGMDPTCGSVEL